MSAYPAAHRVEPVEQWQGLDLAAIEDRITAAVNELEECAVLLDEAGLGSHEIYEAVGIILDSTRSLS